jgi:hypothetical protein
MNYDLNSILMALQGGQQQPQQTPAAEYMDSLRETNPSGYASLLGNKQWNNIQGMSSAQQQSAPSWLDAINHTLNAGTMMNMNPFNQNMGNMNTMGYMGGMGQAQPNWWQKGLQGTGSFLQGAASPATQAGLAGLSMGLPHALPVAAGGVIGGGLGNLFQYLGQPGQAGIQRDTGAPMQQTLMPMGSQDSYLSRLWRQFS